MAGASSRSLAAEEAAGGKAHLEPIRWWVLLAFGLAETMQGLMWMTFRWVK